MARDFLSVSGSEVPIESLFSNGPDLWSRLRLGADAVTQCICLKTSLQDKRKIQQDLTISAEVTEKMSGAWVLEDN